VKIHLLGEMEKPAQIDFSDSLTEIVLALVIPFVPPCAPYISQRDQEKKGGQLQYQQR
jgi:hypothetical protein